MKPMLAVVAALFVAAGTASGQGMQWVNATDSAPWPARIVFSSVTFSGQMWVLGGAIEGWDRNDVWCSQDGSTWTEATDSAGWCRRQFQAAAVFSNKMWVLGGVKDTGAWKPMHDVWWTLDGANWTRATDSAGWSARDGHSAAVFGGKMWLFGGVDSFGFRGDAWSSTDGVNWTKEADSAGWGRRVYQATVVYDGQVFIMGGGDDDGHLFADVWSSFDGKTWSLVTDSAGWGPRGAFAAVVYDSMIWVMGGTTLTRPCNNDIWCSKNGRDWTEVMDSPPWAGRNCHAGLVLNGNIWVLGGITDSGYVSDVWYSTGLGVSEQKSRIAVPNATRVIPNPFTRHVAVAWSPSLSSGGTVRVYAQDGRLVRQARIPAGDSRWVWDGRDNSGVPLPPGVYVIEAGPGLRAKVVKLK